MNRFVLATSLTALCASAVAQSPSYQTVPPGFLSKEAGNYHWQVPGYYKQGHRQIMDGTQKGKAMVIKGIGWRPDGGRTYTTSIGMGRKFTNITVAISQSNFNSLSRTWTLNQTNTPTTVFSGPHSYPTISGKPPSPAPWGLAQFNFSSNYVHTGVADICMDFKMTGGTLNNGLTWSTTSARSYYVDASKTVALNNSYNFEGYTPYGKGVTDGGCVDSGSTRTYGSYNYFYFYTYGDKYSSTSYTGKTRCYFGGSYFGPSANAFVAMCAKANPTGVAFPGVTCNKLHVDLGPASLVHIFPKKCSTSGSMPSTYPVGTYGVKHNPAWAGIELTIQTAAEDTKKPGTILLSRAAKSVVPAKPTATEYYRTRYMYHYNKASTTGNGPYINGQLWRYTN